jgi:cytochrome c nitrite reductase small subunit
MPENFVNKLYTKAENGYRHSMRFTFMDFHDPIQITPRNVGIVEQNCRRCHDALVHNITNHENEPKDAVSCVKCHSHVGHGAR